MRDDALEEISKPITANAPFSSSKLPGSLLDSDSGFHRNQLCELHGVEYSSIRPSGIDKRVVNV